MSISVAMLRFWVCLALFVAALVIGVLWPDSAVTRIIISPISAGFFAGVLLSLREWYKTIHIPAKRDQRGECLNCGYPLHEELNRCPECGSLRESQLDS